MRRLLSFLLPFLLASLFAWPIAAQTQPVQPTPTQAPVAILTVTPLPDATAAPAQSEPEPEPTPEIPQFHIVADGDTLYAIAEQYAVTVADLQRVNQLTDADFLSVGQELLIPGVAGEVTAAVYAVHVGDTLDTIAAAFGVSAETILTQNQLINPNYLIASQPLALQSKTGSTETRIITGTTYIVQPADTLLIVATRHKLAPSELAQMNGIMLPAYLTPGQRLRLPGDDVYADLPAEFSAISMRDNQLMQGGTSSLYVSHLSAKTIRGRITTHTGSVIELPFMPSGVGFISMLGFSAFAQPGLYTLELFVDDEAVAAFTQAVPLVSANYGFRQIGADNDQAVREAEEATLKDVYGMVSAEVFWSNVFQAPIPAIVTGELYGDARSYNGGPYDQVFHTGVDYPAPAGAIIHAAAPGNVVFVGDTPIHGILTIIDHGLGVMSSYAHQSQALVAVGDAVTMGQPIGNVGSTGLSTGAHLHWEVRIHGVPVDPLSWLVTIFP